jgi:transcription elongation factor GreA
MAETYLTRAGHLKLQEDLKALMKQKAQLSLDIGEAREKGDLKENAEYHSAKEKMGEVMGRIGQIQDKLQSAKISVQSPLGSGLLGRKSKETVEIQLPNGPRTFKILKVARTL